MKPIKDKITEDYEVYEEFFNCILDNDDSWKQTGFDLDFDRLSEALQKYDDSFLNQIASFFNIDLKNSNEVIVNEIVHELRKKFNEKN